METNEDKWPSQKHIMANVQKLKGVKYPLSPSFSISLSEKCTRPTSCHAPVALVSADTYGAEHCGTYN